jgi:hypothetical protein
VQPLIFANYHAFSFSSLHFLQNAKIALESAGNYPDTTAIPVGAAVFPIASGQRVAGKTLTDLELIQAK